VIDFAGIAAEYDTQRRTKDSTFPPAIPDFVAVGLNALNSRKLDALRLTVIFDRDRIARVAGRERACLEKSSHS
jgi:hypothetical protein